MKEVAVVAIHRKLEFSLVYYGSPKGPHFISKILFILLVWLYNGKNSDKPDFVP